MFKDYTIIAFYREIYGIDRQVLFFLSPVLSEEEYITVMAIHTVQEHALWTLFYSASFFNKAEQTSKFEIK